MLRLQSADVSRTTTLFDTKVEGIQKILEQSFNIQKTILNESSVCFQMNVPLSLTNVTCLWQTCTDIQKHFDCRCLLTLTRLSAKINPKIQIIVDTDDRPINNAYEKVNNSNDLEDVLGCDSNYSVFHVPGAVLIKCSVALDEDGILNLGRIMDVTDGCWGKHCKNVSLFGNAESEEKIQTIYVTLNEDFFNNYDDNMDDDNDDDDDDDNTEQNNDDNYENIEDNDSTEIPPVIQAEPIAALPVDEKDGQEMEQQIEQQMTDRNVVRKEESTTLPPTSLTSTYNNNHNKNTLSRFTRTSLFAALTGLTGIVIPIFHFALQNRNAFQP